MKKVFKTVVKVIAVVVGICVFYISMLVAFADDGIRLKDVNSTNYDQYIKPDKAAYGYNKGECKRKYLPHEEHFYGDYYDHWNVDVVYDKELITKLYTDFEKTKPVIERITCDEHGVYLRWTEIEDAEKYIISVKRDRKKWNVLDIVDGDSCSYAEREMVKKGTICRYSVQAVKHVRFWDVKSAKSDARCITL